MKHPPGMEHGGEWQMGEEGARSGAGGRKVGWTAEEYQPASTNSQREPNIHLSTLGTVDRYAA